MTELSYATAKNIRAEYGSGQTSIRQLSQKYGLSKQTLSRILLGEIWLSRRTLAPR